MNRQSGGGWEGSPPLSGIWELICPPPLPMTLLSEDELNKGAFRVTGDLNPTLTFEWALEIPDFEHLVGQRGGGYVPVSLQWARGCSLSSFCRWTWACLTLVKQNSGWITREMGLSCEMQKESL